MPARPTFWFVSLIMDRVAVLRLSAIYHFPEVAEEGGFVAFGAPPLLSFQCGCPPNRKGFRGIKVLDIPREQPTKFELVINLRTAKALDLSLPPASDQLAETHRRRKYRSPQCGRSRALRYRAAERHGRASGHRI